ncbi:MAG: Pyocin activator protein PrtN [Devosia sp.]|jgi:hypothetical protein|nr:Pyocin activator protein PrtN [Devosia sp.]
MDTVWLLAAKYEGAVLIPLDVVCRDFFSHLTPAQLWRKYNEGNIPLPIVLLDPKSKKTAKGVHLHDLADWIDARRDAARSEVLQITGSPRLGSK